MPDYNDDTLYMALNPPVNPKSNIHLIYMYMYTIQKLHMSISSYPCTHKHYHIHVHVHVCTDTHNMYMYYFLSLFLAKVRRLYDIANILTSLGLITKKVFIGPHHIKKPGYAWSGPTIPDIDAVCKYKYMKYM